MKYIKFKYSNFKFGWMLIWIDELILGCVNICMYAFVYTVYCISIYVYIYKYTYKFFMATLSYSSNEEVFLCWDLTILTSRWCRRRRRHKYSGPFFFLRVFPGTTSWGYNALEVPRWPGTQYMVGCQSHMSLSRLSLCGHRNDSLCWTGTRTENWAAGTWGSWDINGCLWNTVLRSSSSTLTTTELQYYSISYDLSGGMWLVSKKTTALVTSSVTNALTRCSHVRGWDFFTVTPTVLHLPPCCSLCVTFTPPSAAPL